MTKAKTPDYFVNIAGGKKNHHNEHPEDLRELEEYFNQSND